MFTDRWSRLYFFFNDTATTEIYTLSLHDALPIWLDRVQLVGVGRQPEHRQPRPGRDQLGHRGAGVGVELVPDQHDRPAEPLVGGIQEGGVVGLGQALAPTIAPAIGSATGMGAVDQPRPVAEIGRASWR